MVLSYEDEVLATIAHLSLDGAVDTVKKWIKKNDLPVMEGEESVDDLEVNLDNNGEWSYWCSGSWAQGIKIKKTALCE